MKTFVRVAVAGLLAGCASHAENASVTLAPVTPSATQARERGVLSQPTRPEPKPEDRAVTICVIDPSACDKSACSGATSCSGKAACAGHP